MNEIVNQPQSKPKSRTILWLVVFLLICGIGFLGFCLVQLQNNLIDKEQTLQKELIILRTGLAQQQLMLQKLTTQQKTDSLTSASLLTEVSYLVKAANLALLMENDVTSALNFLTTAKQQLTSKPEFLALNSALDKDIATLQASATINVEKLIARLENLLQKITAMDTSTFIPPPKIEKISSDASLAWWRKLLNSTLQELQRALVIKHYENDNTQSLTVDQLAGAKLNLQFRLLQAEWALMQRNPTLYQSSLKSANDWLRKYFSHYDLTTQLLQELQELQAISVPTKPHIQATAKEILNFK